MKKILLILTAFVLSASISFAQPFDITFGLPDVDISTLNVGDDVIVPVIMVSRVPTGVSGSMVIGFDLYIGFDHSILTWKGTNPAPLPGVQNFHPLCPYSPADWFFNDITATGEMFALWSDPTYMGADFPDGAVLFEYIFTYNGGLAPGDSSPLIWGTTAKLQGTDKIKMVKGQTNAYTDWFQAFDNVYLEDGSVYIPGVTANEWTGAVNDDWNEAGNWSWMVVPGPSDDVEIPDVSKAPFPVIFGSVVIGALTIFPGAQLTVAPMADLTTFGPCTNNGTFVIESSGLVIFGQGESGSYIDMAGVGGAGVFEFQRDITNWTAYGSQNGWHLISSPLPAGEFTSDDLYYYYMNYWDNATQLYVHYAGSPTIPCTPAATLPNNLMEGWSIKYDTLYQNLCAGGVPDYDINMMGTNFNTGVQAAGFGVGWDLLGNPYPSAIDVDAISWAGGLNTNTVYMWDGWVGGWVLGFLGSGNNIPPAQGFFVDGASADNFQLLGTERIHDPFQWWWKGSSDLLRLRATVQGADNYDDTYIRFNDVSTVGLDKEWDANKLFAGVTETPQIYTTTGGLELALNTQPETEMVPMSFICGATGTYTIEAIKTGSFAHVVLEDVLTGEQTDLLKDSYTFEYTNVSEVHPFIVHFTPLGIGELGANSFNIWSSEHNIYVNVPKTAKGDIVVFNMMGQEVVRTDIEPGLNTIPMNDVNTYYVVKVLTSDNAVTGKVYIK